MPNVLGREFPYTPEGEAAALRYSRDIGMRGGGMMGFRPVGYQEGTGPSGAQLSGVEAQRSDVLAIVGGLMDALKGSESDVLTYVSTNRMDLENIATLPGKQFDIVRNVLSTLQGPGSGVTESPGWDPGTREYFPPQPFPGGTGDLGIPAPLPPGLEEELLNLRRFADPDRRRGLPEGPVEPPGYTFDPNEIEVAHGGYVGRGRRGMRGGGILSLRR